VTDLPGPPPPPPPLPPPAPGQVWSADGTVARAEAPTGPQPLAPAALVLWRIQGAAFALVVSLLALSAATLVAQASDGPSALPAAVGTAVSIGAWVLGLAGPGWAHRRWRYELAEDTLELRHGVVVHAESSIPYFRVQHVDINQGPLERWLGVARLEIATASSATDAQIPGVAEDLAEPIRARILGRTEGSDGV
jgi:uncharacterized protein